MRASLRSAAPSLPHEQRSRRRSGGRASAARAAADSYEEGALLPPPEVKSWSRKALRRIEREGPREADLRDEAGRIVKECLPRARDVKPPDWRATQRLPFGQLMASLRDGSAASVEVWSDRDPNVYWPPQPIHQPFEGKRALVRFADGSSAYTDLVLPEMERVATSALVSSEGTVPYTFHQAPGREGYTQLDLGLLAIGGGIFIFVSIYLGIVRKGGIPTDTIQAMEFGQSKAKSRKEGMTGITFKDVAGLQTVLEELTEVVAFLKDPSRFNTVGARPPRGLLLEGGPGTGKTLVAKAIAGEAGVPFYSMSGSEFVEVIVGVGAARIRDLFRRARVNAPCIIFVDEIDALGGKRAPSSVRGSEEREQTLNQLLTEMDGFTADTGVIFVGATNRADLLDPALLRPGRFDRRVRVRLPDAEARRRTLEIHTQGRVPLSPEVDLTAVAAQLAGFSGAELAAVCNEAALNAARRNAEAVAAQDFSVAAERMQLGVTRSGEGMAGSERRRVALREAGRALISSVLCAHPRAGPSGGLPPVLNLSLTPRGEEWSRTVWQRPTTAAAEEQQLLLTAPALLARLRVLLGGVSAERMAGEGGGASTLCAADLQDATTLARRLVADYGMVGQGLTSFVWGARYVGNVPARLGAAAGEGDVRGSHFAPSDEALGAAERSVELLMRSAMLANGELLGARAGALQALTDALLERRELSGEQVRELIAAHPPLPGLEDAGVEAATQPALAG